LQGVEIALDYYNNNNNNNNNNKEERSMVWNLVAAVPGLSEIAEKVQKNHQNIFKKRVWIYTRVLESLLKLIKLP